MSADDLTLFDDADGAYCEVCGLALYEGDWCPECDGPRGEVTYVQLYHGDHRGALRFAGACSVPLTLMMFAPSVAFALVVGVIFLIALGVWCACKLGLQYRTGAASNSPEQGAR